MACGTVKCLLLTALAINICLSISICIYDTTQVESDYFFNFVKNLILVDIFTIAIIAVWKEDECCIKFIYVVFVIRFIYNFIIYIKDLPQLVGSAQSDETQSIMGWMLAFGLTTSNILNQTLILVLILKMLRLLKKKRKGDPIIIAAGSEEVEPLKKKKPIAEHA